MDKASPEEDSYSLNSRKILSIHLNNSNNNNQHILKESKTRRKKNAMG